MTALIAYPDLLTGLPMAIVCSQLDEGQALAQTLQQTGSLRSLDQVHVISIDGLLGWLDNTQPAVVMIHQSVSPSDTLAVLQKLAALPVACQSLVLLPAFNEDIFLSVFDAGAHDVLIAPVPNSYLLSRLLLALQAAQQRRQLLQTQQLLKDLAVMDDVLGILTPGYFLRCLTKAVQKAQDAIPADSLALLLLQVSWQSPQPQSADVLGQLEEALKQHVADQLKHCCRSNDLLGELLLKPEAKSRTGDIEHFTEAFSLGFAMLLPSSQSQAIQAITERLNNKLRQNLPDALKHRLTFELKIGQAVLSPLQSADELLQAAMQNLWH